MQKKQQRKRKGSFRKPSRENLQPMQIPLGSFPPAASELGLEPIDALRKLFSLLARLPPIRFIQWAASFYIRAVHSAYSFAFAALTMPVEMCARAARFTQTQCNKIHTASTQRNENDFSGRRKVPSTTLLRAVDGDGMVTGGDLVSRVLNDETPTQTVTLKARVADAASLERIESTLFQLTDSIGSVRLEEEVYFRVPEGQLKLRTVRKPGEPPSHLAHLAHGGSESGRDGGEVVAYKQTNHHSTPNYSEARVMQVRSGMHCLRRTLCLAMQELGTLVKKRRSYSSGSYRINLDEVHGLGHFIDIDIHSPLGQSREESVKEAKKIQAELGLADSALVPFSYLELYLKNQQREQGRLNGDDSEKSSTAPPSSADSGLGSNEDLASLASVE